MSDDDAPSLAELTTRIVTAYFRRHDLAATDVGRLVTTVGTELGGLGRPAEQPRLAEPAVPVRESIRRDSLVCLVCGRPLKSLRRHLLAAHGLTPGQYIERFGLVRDYPMIASASSERRAEIARRTGLGTRLPPAAAPEPQPPAPQPPEPQSLAPAEPAPEQPRLRLPVKPIRGRRAGKRTEAATGAVAADDPARLPQPEPESEPGPKPQPGTPPPKS